HLLLTRRRRGRWRGAWPWRQAQQLDLEDQSRIGRNDRRAGRLVGLTLRSVAERRRDPQAPLAAYLHAKQAFVPTTDHLLLPELEREARAAGFAAGVERLTVGEPSRVLDLGILARLSGVAGAHLQVTDLQPVRIGHRA